MNGSSVAPNHYVTEPLFQLNKGNEKNDQCLHYGILCCRSHSDRICEALLPSPKDQNDDGWLKLVINDSDAAISTTGGPLSKSEENITPSNSKLISKERRDGCMVVPTKDLKGGRKSRRGFTMLIIMNGSVSPADLPPMARKQISWVGRLTHKTFLKDSFRCNTATQKPEVCIENDGSGINGKNKSKSKKHRAQSDTPNIEDVNQSSASEILNTCCSSIWKELTSSGFDVKKHTIRIDIHPKSLSFAACMGLQAAAKQSLLSCVNKLESDSAQEMCTGDGSASAEETSRQQQHCSEDLGPITFTRSAANATIFVNIIVCPPSTSNLPVEQIYWGVSLNKEHWEELNHRMNDFATNEVILEAAHPLTGHDVHKATDTEGMGGKDAPTICEVDRNTPVSRAYYKLSQVFEDDNLLQKMNSAHNSDLVLSHGSGLDIGSSPGGWTQVLRNNLNVPVVVAVDPGIMAQRVTKVPGVFHIRDDISSAESMKSVAEHAPYSFVVCDACIDSYILVPKIVDALEGVASLLNQCKEGSSSDRKCLFKFPFCFVVTLKLPFKTSGSMNTNLEKVNRVFPNYLRRLAALGFDNGENGSSIEVKYQVCHLFANSESERTVVSTFHRTNNSSI